jgi:hypothetical protein
MLVSHSYLPSPRLRTSPLTFNSRDIQKDSFLTLFEQARVVVEHTTLLAGVHADHAEQLRKLKEDHAQQVAHATTSHLALIKWQQAAHATELSALNKEVAERLRSVEEDAARVDAEHAQYIQVFMLYNFL